MSKRFFDYEDGDFAMSISDNIVGHADINMTEHYLHVQEPIRKDAVTRFSDTFIDFENVDEVNELVPL